METNQMIRKMKAVKQQRRISYNDIMTELTVNGSPTVSMTTLRRVFAEGSEDRASSFNYEETLLPIAQAMRNITGCPDDHSEETEQLCEEIRNLEEQLNKKDEMIMRLIDRLDQKDEIIRQFLIDLRQKDEMIKTLMDKCL